MRQQLLIVLAGFLILGGPGHARGLRGIFAPGPSAFMYQPQPRQLAFPSYANSTPAYIRQAPVMQQYRPPPVSAARMSSLYAPTVPFYQQPIAVQHYANSTPAYLPYTAPIQRYVSPAPIRYASPLPAQYMRQSTGGGYFDPGYVPSQHAQHLGVDYGAPAGTSVYARYPGSVVSNNTGSRAPAQARVIYQDQGTTTQEVFGHIYSTSTPGQIFAPGQFMGVVGNQGTNSHLHYGRNTNGIPQVGWGRAPVTATPTYEQQQGWVNPGE